MEYIPLRTTSFGMGEGSNEAAAGSIDVDWDVNASLRLIFVQDLADLLDRLVMASVGASEYDKDANRVLVDVLLHQFRIEPVAARLAHVKDPGFDFEVAGKLLQGNLSVGAHEDVRLAPVLSLLVSTFLPSSLHGETPQMNGFTTSSGGGSDGSLALLHPPQVTDDADTPRMHVHHRGILVCIAHVLGQVLNHQLLGLFLHVGAHKGGQVEIGLSIQVELVLEHLVHAIGGGAILRDYVFADLGLRGIARRVRGDGFRGILDVDVMIVSLGAIILQLREDLLWVDLLADLSAYVIWCPVVCEVPGH